MLAIRSYNTDRIALVNTRRIISRGITVNMGEQGDRLRSARISAGYSTAQAACDAFGWQAGAYRHHENGTRSFDIHAAKRYARAFKVNAGWLLALDVLRAPPLLADADETLEIAGIVQAGIWRAEVSLPQEDRYRIKVGPPPVAGAERFAVRLEGASMDKVIPPGSDLECLRVAFGSVEPKPGDLVIVERTRHELTELTCKRLALDNGNWVLRAESTKDEFQGDIVVGKPDRDLAIDDETRVVGIVVRAYQNHFRAS